MGKLVFSALLAFELSRVLSSDEWSISDSLADDRDVNRPANSVLIGISLLSTLVVTEAVSSSAFSAVMDSGCVVGTGV